jgi:ribonuclease R
MKRSRNNDGAESRSGEHGGRRSAAAGRGGAKARAPSDWRGRDPEAAAEASRYEHPIPSRILILDTLDQDENGMTLDDLIARFGLRRLSEQEALNKRLVAMTRDGQLVQDQRGTYRPPAGGPLPARVGGAVEGRVSAHRDGYGFVAAEGGGADVFLSPPQMRGIIHGDRVRVRVTGEDERGRREGVLVQVIERGRRTLVGRLQANQGVYVVVPGTPKLPEVIVPPGARGGAQDGQMVVVELTPGLSDRSLPQGKVIEVLGEHLAPGMEIEVAARSYDLPRDWPAEVEREAAAFAPEVLPEQIQGRVDLRGLGLVTIDGADARDFDDAVYAEAGRGGGWKLWVAIADVSAYVMPGSALDEEALRRGNSIYFPQQVIPMLPEALSNGLCSLNPAVDRLCLVCEMRVSADGSVPKSRFYEAVMRSQARLIYEDVAAMLDDPAGEQAQQRPELLPRLQTLRAVFDALFAAREQRGAIDFEGGETRIVFGPERKIERIVPVRRTLAHRLIEECMVAANVEAAKLVERHKMPALYRVHAEPDPDKIAVLREFLAGRGLRLGGGAVPTAIDFAKTLQGVKGRPDAGHVQNVMLRAMMQARYGAENTGHFGLALGHYAHFTSPIRRYPDLVLHRAIKQVLERGKAVDFIYTEDQLEQLGAHCSMAERRADEATRDVVNWLKCEFMSHRVGEELDGIVTSVAPFGLFVELDGLYIEGLIHVSTLAGDYYEFDARHQRLTGTRSKQVFALGDRLHVKVARVSPDERRIDLMLVRRGEAAARTHAAEPDHGTVARKAEGRAHGRGKGETAASQRKPRSKPRNNPGNKPGNGDRGRKRSKRR